MKNYFKKLIIVGELETANLHHSLMKIVIQFLSKSIVTVRKMCTKFSKESRLNLFAHHESANLHEESPSISSGNLIPIIQTE